MLEPFQYEFFVKGLIATTLVGALCGLIGVYIVLRRMAYVGHGLSHAIFGGAVVSYVMSINFFIGATVWGFVASILIILTTRKRQIETDSAIGIVTTASFALGVAIISRYNTFTRDFEAALIGNMLGVSMGDLIAIAIVTAAAVVCFFAGYKLLLFTTFDPEAARFYNVPTGWVDAFFSLVLAATIVVSMQVVGVTLIAAAIVIPPVIARLLTHSFRRMLILSTALGAFCGLAGIYVSWYVDVSSGASVVLFAAFIFLIVMGFTGLRDRRRTRVATKGFSQGSEPLHL